MLTYGEMIERIADLMLRQPPVGRTRREHRPPITARVAAAIADEDPELVLPLMESLQGDLLPRDDHAARAVGRATCTHSTRRSNTRWASGKQSEPLAAR